METWDVIVVGAGPAGLLAATRAAERGRRTLLLEKSSKAGVKIYMSGGTRCNLTHATDVRGIAEAFGPAGRFLYSPLAALGPQDLVELVAAEGVATKVEPGGKIFPVSDRAADVVTALLARLGRSGAALALKEPVTDIVRDGERFQVTTGTRTVTAEKLVLASGGKSYPGCGTTGDGYAWAAALGHTLAPARPALVPVISDGPWIRSLSGITVPDVLVRVVETEGKVLAERRGSFLFTHFGLSGPVVLDVSRAITGHPRPRSLRLVCDFLPAMGKEDLYQSISREASAAGKKQLAGLLDPWLPRRLAETLMEQAGVAADRKAAEFGSQDRRRLIDAVKQLSISVSGTLGFEKAEVTAGGVALAEVDSRTMQSKLVSNLYVVGEVLDLDGPIGGYNFQAAWSTGWLAGASV
jgi:predicted Rossmann fold flavoprotein